jgi:hypothetical protein
MTHDLDSPLHISALALFIKDNTAFRASVFLCIFVPLRDEEVVCVFLYVIHVSVVS